MVLPPPGIRYLWPLRTRYLLFQSVLSDESTQALRNLRHKCYPGGALPSSNVLGITLNSYSHCIESCSYLTSRFSAPRITSLGEVFRVDDTSTTRAHPSRLYLDFDYQGLGDIYWQLKNAASNTVSKYDPGLRIPISPYLAKDEAKALQPKLEDICRDEGPLELSIHAFAISEHPLPREKPEIPGIVHDRRRKVYLFTGTEPLLNQCRREKFITYRKPPKRGKQA